MTPIVSAESQGTAINASGQVAGQFATASGFFRAFVYSNGITADLGTLGGTGSFANGINVCGQVTGYSSVSGGSNHAFLYSDGKMVDLGTLGGTVSVGQGINDAAQIVGASLVAGGPQHAFLYSDGEMIDLNSVVVNSLSGFTLTNATGINNIGQIVATGLNSASQEEAFILTPVPEPGSDALIVGGLIVALKSPARRSPPVVSWVTRKSTAASTYDDLEQGPGRHYRHLSHVVMRRDSGAQLKSSGAFQKTAHTQIL
jgi:probable HAF family extracellular repeat protein